MLIRPPFAPGGSGEHDSWKTSLPNPGPDMVNILKRIIALQGEGGLKAPDLLLAFIDARMSPLQRCRTRCACWDPTEIPFKTLPKHSKLKRWRRRRTKSPRSSCSPNGNGA
jgi:hypothetical protein